MPDPLVTGLRSDPSWRVWVCDKAGVPILNISTLAEEKVYTEVLNQPKSFTLSVDPSHPKIRELHGDGDPKLASVRRVLKAFRREWTDIGGGVFEWRYIPRFVGWIWPVQDHGDSDTQLTTITAFDPLHIMAYRLARRSTGEFTKVEFNAVNIGTILRDIVDRTNTAAVTGLITTSGTNTATATASVVWDYKYISEAFTEAYASCDVWVEPLDTITTQHGRLHVYNKRGQIRENLLLGWDAEPHTVEDITREYDPEDAANVVIGLSGTGMIAVAEDAANQTNYLRLEAVQTFSDVKDQTQLNSLTAAELARRVPPQDALLLKPYTNLRPFQDYNVGDIGYAQAGPRLRGGIAERPERIYGMTIAINDEDAEDVTFMSKED
jgi:hypothetical protein